MNYQIKSHGVAPKRVIFDEKDFYETPKYCSEELLKREIFIGKIWEPCAGNGATSQVLLDAGLDVYSSDLVKRDYDLSEIDFLTSQNIVENIITNPPYNIAFDVINKCKELSTNKFALLLRLLFLEGKRRKIMFEDTTYPLKSVYTFSGRVNMMKEKKGSPTICFAWFVWEKNYQEKPILGWI